ncbi:MAG: thiopurine S-methyltransferase [Gammaproteobacteria bacterium]|nr:thiopurine S-methyltransferase [Gammaproteobacteria bacterium]
MQIKDWNHRWENQMIGFHENQANYHLTRYLDQFSIAKNATVFVPLCGKSLDLIWLSQHGYQVIGIECSPKAVVDFFTEQNLSYETHQQGKLVAYTSSNITIYQGDFFDLTEDHLKQCDLIYDRASFVAFTPAQWDQYILHLSTWFGDSTQLFLVTLEYDQNSMNGPPFSVPDKAVRNYYKEKSIAILEQLDVIDEGPKWRKSGLTSLLETSFKITNKN